MKQFSSQLIWQKSHQEMKLTCNLDYSPSSVWLTPAVNMPHNALPFYTQELGNTIANSDYYVYREGLESFFIGYFYGGEGIVEYNGHTTRLVPGMAFWIDCMRPHAYYTAKNRKRFACMFVHFSGDSVKEYYRFYQNICTSGCLSLLPGSDVPENLNKLIELFNKDIRDLQTDFHASSLLAALCSSMIDSACNQEKNSIPDFVTDMRLYLEQYYVEHIDLDLLSKKYFLSKSYLQRQFKKYTGLSPADYLTRVRITQAKQLLRTTVCSIHQIGEMTGIPDASYFVNTFKKTEGMTPAVFRKIWHSGK
ncbi:MAG: AraC family transcriptional regulator [Lachnospiraceae bacterium]